MTLICLLQMANYNRPEQLNTISFRNYYNNIVFEIEFNRSFDV